MAQDEQLMYGKLLNMGYLVVVGASGIVMPSLWLSSQNKTLNPVSNCLTTFYGVALISAGLHYLVGDKESASTTQNRFRLGLVQTVATMAFAYKYRDIYGDKFNYVFGFMALAAAANVYGGFVYKSKSNEDTED
eukprot:55066_1